MWEFVKAVLMEAVNKHIPIKQMKKSHTQMWMNEIAKLAFLIKSKALKNTNIQDQQLTITGMHKHVRNEYSKTKIVKNAKK